jgi:hypothetical protein
VLILKRPAPALAFITDSRTKPRNIDEYVPVDYSPFSRPELRPIFFCTGFNVSIRN